MNLKRWLIFVTFFIRNPMKVYRSKKIKSSRADKRQ